MPNHPLNPGVELQKTIQRGGAVVVAGTGVSLAASKDGTSGKPHPQASWAGLLENGLEWLKQHKHMPEEEADAHLTLIKRGDTHHFVSAAEDITRRMGGVGSKYFEEWLTKTIGTIKASDRRILDALEALRAKGNILATTNYDGLLLGGSGSLKPVTWKEPDAFLRAARNKEMDKIIFLHGYWKQPATVILDWNSYYEIARNESYRDDLATVWKMTTWIYVGCGVNGLNDPDFGLLLERYGKRARNADLWDFCLVRSDQREQFQDYFDKLNFNICAVSFGNANEELPGYLRSLLPSTAVTTSGDALVTRPPLKPIIEFLRITDSFFQYRTPNASGGGVEVDGRGDFRFTAEEFRSGAVHRAGAVDKALQRLRRDGFVWLEGPSAGGKTTVCLHIVAEWNHQGCEPLYLDLGDEPDPELSARELGDQAKLGQMFILDNVHDDPKLACALLDHWLSHRCDSVMIFLGWPAAVKPGHDYLSGYRAAIIPVAVQLEDWIGVYQSIFRQIRGPTQAPPVPPTHIVQEWDSVFAADLVMFQYALAAGLRIGGGNAFHVEQSAADRHVREKYLIPCSEGERRDLFCLAWHSELGLGLSEESATSKFKRSKACGLIRASVHGRFKDHVILLPWHRSFGRLLLRLSPPGNREDILSESTAHNPYSAISLTSRLWIRGEVPLAIKILESTLRAYPSLTVWLSDNLNLAVSLLKLICRLPAPHLEEIGSRLTEPNNLIQLEEQAFATELHLLAGFLVFIGQRAELKHLQDTLVKALVVDANLPADKSRLQSRAFSTSLGDFVTFLRITGENTALNPVRDSVFKALIADANLPPDKSRLQAKAFTTPLHFLARFIQFTMVNADLNPVQDAMVKALVADANLPPDKSRLQAQVFISPLNELVTFLRITGENTALNPVRDSVFKALIADAILPNDKSRLQAKAFTTPLHFLANFFRFTGENVELKPVEDAMVKAIVADTNLPAEQSRFQAQAFTCPLSQLVTFLRFAGENPELKPVQNAVINALAADGSLPAYKSRLQERVFTTPLHFLALFIRFTGENAELKPMRDAILKALVADVNLPADKSRLQARAFSAPLGDLATFLRISGESAEFKVLQEGLVTALVSAVVKDANLPVDNSRLQTQAFITPLSSLLPFLRFAEENAELKPVLDNLVKVLVADANLSADKSRLIQTARKSSYESLRSFVKGARKFLGLSAVADSVESDPVCAKILKSRAATNIL